METAITPPMVSTMAASLAARILPSSGSSSTRETPRLSAMPRMKTKRGRDRHDGHDEGDGARVDRPTASGIPRPAPAHPRSVRSGRLGRGERIVLIRSGIIRGLNRQPPKVIPMPTARHMNSDQMSMSSATTLLRNWLRPKAKLADEKQSAKGINLILITLGLAHRGTQ